MTTFLVSELPVLSGIVGVDIETTYHGKHADPFRDRPVSIQVSDGHDAWVLDVATGNPDQYVPALQELMANPDAIKLFHNAAFDLQFLMEWFDVKPDKWTIWDTLLTERVLNAGKPLSHSLDDVLARRMGVMLDKTTRESFADHTGPFSERQLKYMAADVLYLPRLYAIQHKDVTDLALGRVVGLENRLTVIVARMMLAGVGFDQALWREYVPRIQTMLDELESDIGSRDEGASQLTLFGSSKTNLNIASSKQVLELFDRLGLSFSSTDKKEIARFMQENPDHPHYEVLEKIVEWRKWNHMLSTPFSESVHPMTQRIHCSWNQIGADTGRFSSSGPNLQNVERPQKDRPNLRLLFRPGEGNKFLIADYNQQEPRIYAQLSGDEVMRRACQQDDVYLAMGEVIEGKPISKDSPVRQRVKTGVLAYFYGASPDTLAVHLKIPLHEAEIFSETLEHKFKQAKRWSSRTRNAVLATGMTRTLLGRIRYYPDIKEGRPSNRVLNEAVNMPVQGTGADMLKLALDKFDDVCEGRVVPVLVVHDEIVVECPQEESEMLFYQLVGCMEEAGHELCPDVISPAEGKIASRWEK